MAVAVMMVDANFLHRTWDKWASTHVGSGAGERALSLTRFFVRFDPVHWTGNARILLILVFLVRCAGQPLKAALLLNHDPTGPSRLLATMYGLYPIPFVLRVKFFGSG